MRWAAHNGVSWRARVRRATSRRAAGADTPAPRRYRLGLAFELRWLSSQVARRPRSFGLDATEALARQAPDARVLGREQIPATGAFILVMNHYERPGLGVWWPAILVSEAVREARGEEPPLRWLITDCFHHVRVGHVAPPAPLVRWVLDHVGRTYGLIVVPSPGDLRGRARALLRARRRLEEPGARPLALTPETQVHGLAVRPWRNAGVAISVLSAGTLPVLPAGVREDGNNRLVARFGAPWIPDPPASVRGDLDGRAALAARLAERIDALLVDDGLDDPDLLTADTTTRRQERTSGPMRDE